MRSWLEENGWMQGDFVSPTDIPILQKIVPDLISENDNVYLIVASQSCDVCASSEIEPYIEFSIARKLERIDGNFMFNKNPRRLHLEADYSQSDGDETLFLELLIYEKISIPKDAIESINKIEPCKELKLSTQTLQQYVNWLASRYNRPALPTAFERMFNQQWNKSKREKDSEKCSEYIWGIYVDITPDREIREDEFYTVQLLFLISPEIEGDESIMSSIKELAQKYIDNLKAANITVIGGTLIKTEKSVSLATFSKFKRFNLDSLSYKNGQEIVPQII